MRIRGKGLKWLKDLKDSVLKEIVGLWEKEEDKCLDREMKELKVGEFGCSVEQEEEVSDPKERKLRRLLKVGGIKLPGLSNPRLKH